MKPRHVAAYRNNARALLALWRVALGQDFHTLSAAQIDAVLAEADRTRYRKPPRANGSRARYYYELIQRQAK